MQNNSTLLGGVTSPIARHRLACVHVVSLYAHAAVLEAICHLSMYALVQIDDMQTSPHKLLVATHLVASCRVFFTDSKERQGSTDKEPTSHDHTQLEMSQHIVRYRRGFSDDQVNRQVDTEGGHRRHQDDKEDAVGELVVADADVALAVGADERTDVVEDGHHEEHHHACHRGLQQRVAQQSQQSI